MGCNPSLIDQEPATYNPYDHITELEKWKRDALKEWAEREGSLLKKIIDMQFSITELERQVSDLTAERDRLKQLVDAADMIILTNDWCIENLHLNGYLIYKGGPHITPTTSDPGDVQGGYDSILDAYNSILSAAGEGKNERD